MLDKPHRESFLGWTPEPGPDGLVTITDSFGDGSGRYPLRSVTTSEYLRVLKNGEAKFQADSKPHPEHLPTTPQVEDFLSKHPDGRLVSSSAPTPPAPRPSSVAPARRPALAPAPPPRPAPVPPVRLPVAAKPAASQVIEQGAGKPLRVPLSRLRRYEGQPRRYFNSRDIAFTLIGGERRQRAYKLIARRMGTDPLVDCVLGSVKDAKDHFRKAFRDNIKRKDYISRDEANAYLQMYNDCEAETHEEKVLELMREAGKSKKHIENYLLVAGLPEEAKDLMTPDLLDKQLVYLVALEIARSTTDKELRVRLAKETSQQCMGLQPARLYIRRQTGHSNYAGVGRPRRESDEYQAFKTTLANIRNRMTNMKENWDIGGIYKVRPKAVADREGDAALIKEMIAELQGLLVQVEGRASKSARA
jgi:hypothetical protein